MVDPEPCISFGQCVAERPDVFAHNEDGVSEVVPPGLLPREEALEIAARCPVQAISVVEQD
jgi:ferredoxin